MLDIRKKANKIATSGRFLIAMFLLLFQDFTQSVMSSTKSQKRNLSNLEMNVGALINNFIATINSYLMCFSQDFPFLYQPDEKTTD